MGGYRFGSKTKDENIKVKRDTRNLLNQAEFTDNAIWKDGEQLESDEYCFFIIQVEEGEEYLISPNSGCIYNEDGRILMNEMFGPYIYKSCFTGKIFVNFRKNTYGWVVCKTKEKDVIPYNYSKLYEMSKGIGTSKYIGLTILNIGDSIAENRLEANSYSYQFAYYSGAILATDFALSGATVSRVDDQDGHDCILTQAELAITMYPDADYDIIFVDGGVNDHGLDRKVGSIIGNKNESYSVSDYNGTFDDSTFIGALEHTFKILRNTYPNAIIVYIIPHKHSSADCKWEEMLNGARNVCDKWSIALVDIDSSGQLNTRISIMKESYTDEGGTHPNTMGIKRFYLPKIIYTLGQYYINN